MLTEYLPSRLTVRAVASLWGARTFISGVADEKVMFVPPRWNRATRRRGDLALTIRAGGYRW